MFNIYHGQGGEPFIDIWNCRATISREVWKDGKMYREDCVNADSLMEDILAAVDAQGGAINMSGRMACPPELAARAHWKGQGDD